MSEAAPALAANARAGRVALVALVGCAVNSAQHANGSTAMPAATNFAPTAAPSSRPKAIPMRHAPACSRAVHASMAAASSRSTAISL